MKQAYFFLLLFVPVCLFAQLPAKDTELLTAPTDTLLSKIGVANILQDSSNIEKDSLLKQQQFIAIDTYTPQWQKAFQRNVLLNTDAKPVATISRLRPASLQDLFFYTILGLVLLLAFLRFFYSRYFNNLFQVFFNTSLRQSQLTDQLLQAKQASLLFNLFFSLTGGLYVFFLIRFFNKAPQVNVALLMGSCIIALAGIYFFKYISLKLTGWLSGNRSAVDTYLFIIFLINKILSVLLLPFVIVIAFGESFLQYPAVIISLLMISLMFFLRFVRSYVLLQHQIKISRFHFFMYIIGVELLPLLLIYKGLVVLLTKNL